MSRGAECEKEEPQEQSDLCQLQRVHVRYWDLLPVSPGVINIHLGLFNIVAQWLKKNPFCKEPLKYFRALSRWWRDLAIGLFADLDFATSTKH